MSKRYVIEDETNEFREMVDDEEEGNNIIVEENEIEFLDGDIQAIFVYNRGDKVTRIGIISDDKLLVAGDLNSNAVTALYNLFGRRHNDNLFNR